MAAKLLSVPVLLRLVVLVLNVSPNCFARISGKNPDVYLTTTELIEKCGYPAEKHSVTTEDGYVLEVHRIPHRQQATGNKTSPRPPVLLQHGLTGCSSDWIITGPGRGLGYLLADLGYDVWLGNSRGNTFSRKHVSLDPDRSSQFWDFSWHELGMYDIPAVIDYILAETAQPKLFYVGHSQGTTQFYVMASERPEYNDKIQAMFSLAPVAFMSHATSPIYSSPAMVKAFIGSRIREFLPHSEMNSIFGEKYCSDGRPTQNFCIMFFGLLYGFDTDQANATTLPVFIGHNPEGISTKQVFHYAQEYASGKFRQYDYGRKGNLGKYGRATPPDYDLSQISAPVSLHYGQNDFLVSPVDVKTLYKGLANPIGKFLVPFPKFNHIDFLVAIDVKTLLYDQLTSLMKKYQDRDTRELFPNT